MSRIRTPLNRAAVEGRDIVHPERYRKRREPAAEPLGPAATWLPPDAAEAFETFRTELPWLKAPHRVHVEIAAILMAQMKAGTGSVQGANLLRLCLAQMGGNPTSTVRSDLDIEQSDDLLD